MSIDHYDYVVTVKYKLAYCLTWQLQQQVTEEQQNTYQQYEISSTPQVEGQQEYEVAIIENPTPEPRERYIENKIFIEKAET